MKSFIQILINCIPTTKVPNSKLIKFFLKIIYFMVRKFTNGPYIIKTEFFSIYSYTSRNEPSSVYFRNFHDYQILKTICNLYDEKKNLFFIDIGANVGSYSLTIAKNFKNSKCVAFEPVPYYFDQFKKNIELNKLKNIIVSNECVSNNNTKNIDFFVNNTLPGSSGLSNKIFTFHPKIKDKDNFEKIIRNSIKLDELEKKYDFINCENFLIKVDVEGAEKKVIEGAENIISKFKPDMLIEIQEGNLEKDQNIINSLKFFERLGYKFHKSINSQSIILSNFINELENLFNKKQTFHLDLFISQKNNCVKLAENKN